MKTIYLVRHGQTNHNAEHLIQGSDAILSEHGQMQAKAVAKRVATLHFENFLVSDYVRTRETAAAIAPLVPVRPEYTELVRESKRPSIFINQSNQTKEFQDFLTIEEQNLADPDWHYADEENFFDVVHRVERLFDLIESRNGNTLVVTHGRFIIYVVAFVLAGKKLTPEFWRQCRYSFETANTGITVIKYNETHQNWRLHTFNDQAHFAEV